MNLAKEISAFDAFLPEPRASHQEGWVTIVGDGGKGSFSSFEAAARSAVERFPDQEFLIRHTDAEVARFPFIVVKD